MTRRNFSPSLFTVLILLVTALIASGCRSADNLSNENPIHTSPMLDRSETDHDVSVYVVNPEENFNTESYKVFDENPFILAAQRGLSTFSADVNTASYANIRRYLNASKLPPKDAVRMEEMINYFRYDYETPEADQTFAVKMQISDTPWNAETKLLHIAMQTQAHEVENEEPNNLVFLIDVSGSMNAPEKLDLVKRTFISLLEELENQDRISIVTYAGSDQVVLDGATAYEKAEIMDAIENLTAQGSTHGSAGIKKAYEIARKHFIPGGNNRILLATDGDLNVGISSEGELKQLIEKEKESGVFLSVLGFGQGNLKDDKLQTLANNGNGIYHYIDTIHEARKVLFEEIGQNLLTVAKDVKLQVDFNPYYIKGYRLIGYENSLMADEDFRDDSKDGGELGSGHQITVLYELVSEDSSYEIPHADSKYKNEKNSGIENNELLQLNIRYKDPHEDTSEELNIPLSSEDWTNSTNLEDGNTVLAANIAAFGMLLRDSEYIGEYTYENIYNALQELNTDNSYVKELMELVLKTNALHNAQ